MKWLDGSELDLTQFTGKTLCEKLAVEMYEYSKEKWHACDDFIQDVLYVTDFDTVSNMEGFSTPYDGYFTVDDYTRIIHAFRAIGDHHDADLLTEALRLDADYTEQLGGIEDEDEAETVYEAFCNQTEALEQELYLNTGFDIWAMIYQYLESHIRQQEA